MWLLVETSNEYLTLSLMVHKYAKKDVMAGHVKVCLCVCVCVFMCVCVCTSSLTFT